MERKVKKDASRAAVHHSWSRQPSDHIGSSCVLKRIQLLNLRPARFILPPHDYSIGRSIQASSES